MTTMTLEIPAATFAMIQERVAKGEAANEAAFVRDVIQNHLRDVEAQRKHLEKMIDEGLSGESVVADDAFWQARIDRLAAKSRK